MQGSLPNGESAWSSYRRNDQELKEVGVGGKPRNLAQRKSNYRRDAVSKGGEGVTCTKELAEGERILEKDELPVKRFYMAKMWRGGELGDERRKKIRGGTSFAVVLEGN